MKVRPPSSRPGRPNPERTAGFEEPAVEWAQEIILRWQFAEQRGIAKLR